MKRIQMSTHVQVLTNTVRNHPVFVANTSACKGTLCIAIRSNKCHHIHRRHYFISFLLRHTLYKIVCSRALVDVGLCSLQFNAKRESEETTRRFRETIDRKKMSRLTLLMVFQMFLQASDHKTAIQYSLQIICTSNKLMIYKANSILIDDNFIDKFFDALSLSCFSAALLSVYSDLMANILPSGFLLQIGQSCEFLNRQQQADVKRS